MSSTQEKSDQNDNNTKNERDDSKEPKEESAKPASSSKRTFDVAFLTGDEDHHHEEFPGKALRKSTENPKTVQDQQHQSRKIDKHDDCFPRSAFTKVTSASSRSRAEGEDSERPHPEASEREAWQILGQNR